MDLKMPLMDGYEAAKQIRDILPEIPIIAQTAYTSELDKSKALESGCNDFITKPINYEFLFEKLTNSLVKFKIVSF